MCDESEDVGNDCAVCLQKCQHPTQLPCGHIFCFLCVKGVAIQNKKCAMCRAVIPPDYLEHPILLAAPTPEEVEEEPDKFQWYYEGKNGWWKYDERSNHSLELAFISGDSECSLLLAGAVYCVHFQNMVQARRSDPTRRRKVKRDCVHCVHKGIAGIKIMSKTDPTNLEDGVVMTVDDDDVESNDDVMIVGDNRSDDIITLDDDDTRSSVDERTHGDNDIEPADLSANEATLNTDAAQESLLDTFRSLSMDAPADVEENVPTTLTLL